MGLFCAQHMLQLMTQNVNYFSAELDRVCTEKANEVYGAGNNMGNSIMNFKGGPGKTQKSNAAEDGTPPEGEGDNNFGQNGGMDNQGQNNAMGNGMQSDNGSVAGKEAYLDMQKVKFQTSLQIAIQLLESAQKQVDKATGRGSTFDFGPKGGG